MPAVVQSEVPGVRPGPGGDRGGVPPIEYGYGRTNQFGLPVIEQVTLDGETAYLENDPVTGQPLMLRTSGGTQTLYRYDGIGNPEALVTNIDTVAFAYDYDPYGVPTLTQDSGGQGEPINPYQFKGGIHDRTTNWVKFGHRWYSVGTGRFTQRDTLDAPLDPANANRYAFAANDPINNADPLGLYAWEDAVGDIAGAWVTASSIGIGVAAGGPVGGAIGAAAGGCLGGMVSEVVTARIKGEQKEVGGDDIGLRCAVGAFTGSMGG